MIVDGPNDMDVSAVPIQTSLSNQEDNAAVILNAPGPERFPQFEDGK